MVVWTGTHLCHNLRALGHIIRLIYLITDVFHTTYSVKYVILLVNTTSHVALICCSYSLSTSIRELLCNGPAWTSCHYSRLWCYRAEILLDSITRRCSNLGRWKVIIYAVSPAIVVLAGKVSLLVHEVFLLLNDAFTLVFIHRCVIWLILFNFHRLIVLIVVCRFA